MAERTLLQRLHNPRNRGCGCDSDCWCNRTALGRAVKWWFPARWFGIEHKHTRIQNMAPAEREEWKRQQDAAGGAEQMSAREEQPSYESMIRLGPMRFGMTARRANGSTAIHELGRPAHPSRA